MTVFGRPYGNPSKQTLVLQTQGLARATSLNSLNDCSFEERTTRGGSLPPPVPRPSAGAACSTIGSDHEWNDYDTATIQRQVTGTNIERSILIFSTSHSIDRS